MRRIIKVIGIIILILGLLVLRTVWKSGAFKSLDYGFGYGFAATTQRINGLIGVEDITIDQSTGIAFLSSSDRWALMIRHNPVKGAIYSLNLRDSSFKAIELTRNFEMNDFHPHGISLFTTPLDRRKILFVINHRENGNSFVERFEYRNDSLVHLESITHKLMVSPNDLVATGERSFYFTNDHDEKASGWRRFKDLLAIGTGNVCLCEGDKCSRTSVTGVKYANGINMSADGAKVYVSESSDMRIRVYDRDLASNTLAHATDIETGTGVDNIELDADGNLWVGCHPKLLKFLSHSGDETSISPSEIIKIIPTGTGYEQKTVYMNDGSEISASSVGAVYKNKLLIGPVFQDHIIVATMK
jgi:arylesterase/paraoxonase